MWGVKRWMWAADESASHALRGRFSRSEISTGGEEVGCVVTTRVVVGLLAMVLILAATFFFGFTVTSLGAAVGLGLGFLGLAVFLVTVTVSCLGASVTGWGVGFGDVVVLKTPPSNDMAPLLAQIHLLGRGSSPLSVQSSRMAHGGALSATQGCLFARAAFAYFHLVQLGQWVWTGPNPWLWAWPTYLACLGWQAQSL